MVSHIVLGIAFFTCANLRNYTMFAEFFGTVLIQYTKVKKTRKSKGLTVYIQDLTIDAIFGRLMKLIDGRSVKSIG